MYFLLWQFYFVLKKIGMTILSGNLNISHYGLLWIPGLGALYEGKIINKFLNYGKRFEVCYFIAVTIIRVVWILFFCFGPSYKEASFDIISSIISDIYFILFLISAVIKSVALKKNGYNIFVSIIICIFLDVFWCYFANRKIKKIS